MHLKIYEASGAWWIVDSENTTRFINAKGEWKNWTETYSRYFVTPRNTKIWKQEFINSRRLAVAIAKRHVPRLRIEFSEPSQT